MWINGAAVKWLVGGVLVVGAASAFAGSVHARARVVDVRPVYENVVYSVPVEECRMERVVERGRSYTPPIAGAIIGGAIGNALGHHKRNQQIGAVAGALLGGSIGADIARRQSLERAGRYGSREVCEVQYDRRTRERLLGYDVTYRYGGETFTTRLDHDPGDYLPVTVRVTPAV